MYYVASQSQGRKKTGNTITENQRGRKNSESFPVEETGFIMLNTSPLVIQNVSTGFTLIL